MVWPERFLRLSGCHTCQAVESTYQTEVPGSRLSPECCCQRNLVNRTGWSNEYENNGTPVKVSREEPVMAHCFSVIVYNSGLEDFKDKLR